MTDDVSIAFTANVSDLQRGMQQATIAVEATTNALRTGAAQISATFASLSQAYASDAARKIATAQTSSENELAIARQNEQARYDIASNGLKEQTSLVKEQAQTAQISRQEELSSLLQLESQRESIERQHLLFQQSTYQQGTIAYASAQRRIEEVTSESALRRSEIERNVTQQIYSDYRRSFEQISTTVSSSVMSMMTGHLKLRDTARIILLQIIQSFVQAKARIVADWLAGVATQSAATQASEATKTAAVAAGTAARTGLESTASTASMASTAGAVLKSIVASASETFAGVFGFLSPVMGPAAAGPAAGAEAAVLSVGSGLPSFASGAWSLPTDMIAQVHQGEMIMPAGPAASFRAIMESNSGVAGTVHVHHAVNFNVSAMDSQSVRQFFKNHGRTIMRTINEGVRTGSHIGLSKLGAAS
ncbi:hypothetical protein QEV83_05055 [Methylocapsa sp. D3K7]|uniref:hypothetical protein n=1 Tax=Methylocapsa sp. D3K7 TaxID=3041435 RepID=UPI00244F0117|nr:hypothetical protein [Methylocapsa sp. D3K7]WGJ15635.1 hypothetical protein QEV83_05055 [Methylocapsa sp. D3K7]